MEKKITYVEALDVVLADENIVLADNVREKLVALKGSLKRKADNKKETAKQKANALIVADLVEFIKANPKSTIKAIQSNKKFADLQNQKISALLSPLVKSGAIIKDYDKKTPMFSYPTETVEEE